MRKWTRQSNAGTLMRSAGTARRRANGREGFTLIEAAMATVIIGVGVVAMVEAQQAFIFSNAWSSHAATGALLAEEVRELTRNMPRHDPVNGLFMSTNEEGDDILIGWGAEPGEVSVADFDDIDDFDGMIFSDIGSDGIDDGDLPGPINAFGEVITEMNADGDIVLDAEGAPRSMIGWSQQVIVTKVERFNTGVVLADDARTSAADVASYPLRVEVVVTYQGTWAVSGPEEITRVAWIVP